MLTAIICMYQDVPAGCGLDATPAEAMRRAG